MLTFRDARNTQSKHRDDNYSFADCFDLSFALLLAQLAAKCALKAEQSQLQLPLGSAFQSDHNKQTKFEFEKAQLAKARDAIFARNIHALELRRGLHCIWHEAFVVKASFEVRAIESLNAQTKCRIEHCKQNSLTAQLDATTQEKEERVKRSRLLAKCFSRLTCGASQVRRLARLLQVKEEAIEWSANKSELSLANSPMIDSKQLLNTANLQFHYFTSAKLCAKSVKLTAVRLLALFVENHSHLSLCKLSIQMLHKMHVKRKLRQKSAALGCVAQASSKGRETVKQTVAYAVMRLPLLKLQVIVIRTVSFANP